MFANNIGYQQTKEQFLLLTITFCSFGLCSKIVHSRRKVGTFVTFLSPCLPKASY